MRLRFRVQSVMSDLNPNPAYPTPPTWSGPPHTHTRLMSRSSLNPLGPDQTGQPPAWTLKAAPGHIIHRPFVITRPTILPGCQMPCIRTTLFCRFPPPPSLLRARSPYSSRWRCPDFFHSRFAPEKSFSAPPPIHTLTHSPCSLTEC